MYKLSFDRYDKPRVENLESEFIVYTLKTMDVELQLMGRPQL